MREPVTSAHKGKLLCRKFDRGVDEGDATCTQSDDYCEFRERCGIYFLMIERNKGLNKRAKEERDASL